MIRLRSKGFTLIELIAVLVILAIISLIVAPLILNTVRRVKDSVNKRSVDGYGRAVKYAMADYQLVHLTYPDTFDKLEIEYHGAKVECKTSRINPDYSIYLSECKVNGKLVKDDKNKDGYYHYGILKMTNQEYVDTYGKNLEKQLKKYYDEHNEYPSDYTILELPTLEKEVSCDVDINPDGTVYLNNCKVDNENVVDDNNETYVYGNLYATTVLLKKTNSKSITTYTDGNTHEMYTFDHEATEQTPALTDYRYIGNEPYNYVTFNNELWRIIEVFDVEDGDGNWDRRIKLIRNDGLGIMPWNSVINNEWIGSSLQLYLTDSYNLTSSSFDLVSSSVYYLGGRGDTMVNSEQSYISERSLDIYSNNSIKWLGLIGLIYPSDFYFTYSFGIDDTCYNLPRKCNTVNNGNPSYGWLYNELEQWTIMPSSSNVRYAFFITSAGPISVGVHIANKKGARPTLYLKPNVKIKAGDGSVDNPYNLSL